MTDDQMALNTNSGAEPTIASTPDVEEQTTGEIVEPAATTAVEEAGDTVETGDEPKKGENARIRELNARAKEAEQRAQSLERQLAEINRGLPPYGSQELYTPQFEPGTEIDQATLQQQMQRTAISAAQLISAEARNQDRIYAEANQATSKYKQLDPNPDNDDFDQDLLVSVTEATKGFIKANPTGSVKEFVDKLMKPYQRSVAKQVGQASAELAKQVSQTATRPGAAVKVVKTADEKSIKELEAELGFVA